jgi:hypothetical protein
VRDKKANADAVPDPRCRHRFRRALFVIAVGALAGYYMGFRLSEERRGRIKKLMFEGREMWFRIFV